MGVVSVPIPIEIAASFGIGYNRIDTQEPLDHWIIVPLLHVGESRRAIHHMAGIRCW